MQTKITLYSDKKLIEEVKKYAKSKNTSVSKLVNEFFKTLLKRNSKAPITDSLAGVLKGKNISEKDYKKYLEEKYL